MRQPDVVELPDDLELPDDITAEELDQILGATVASPQPAARNPWVPRVPLGMPGVNVSPESLREGVQGAGVSLLRQAGQFGKAAAKVPGIKQVSDWMAPAGMTGEQAIEAFLRSLPEAQTTAGAVGEFAGVMGPAMVAPVGSVGREAIVGGLQAYATGGNPLVGAAVGAATRGLSKLPAAARYLRTASKEQYAKALHPTTLRTKAIVRQQGERMIEQPELRGKSLEDMKVLAEQKRQRAGQAVGRVATANATVEQPMRPIITGIDRLLKKGTLRGGAIVTDPIVPRLRAFRRDLIRLATTTLPDGTVVARPVSVGEIRQVIQGYDKIVDAAGGYNAHLKDLNTQTQAFAARAARRILARELVKTVPDLQVVNQAYNFWSNAAEVLEKSVERKVGQQGAYRRLMQLLGATATGGAAHAAGGDVVTGGLAAGTTALAVEAATTPQWRTVSAHLKKRLARAIEQDDLKTVQRIVGRLMAAGSAQATAGSE